MNDLGILLGHDYRVNDKITIRQPTLREITAYGERRYFGLIGRLTAYPSDMMSELWDIGIDYESVSDFDMFVFMCRSISLEESAILFGGLDFQRMTVAASDVGEPMLWDAEREIRIDSAVHRRIFDFLTLTHGIVKDHKRAGNAHTKKALIELDRSDKRSAGAKKHESGLGTLVSAMVNSAGFKYDYGSIQDITLYQLMDSVARIQIITSSLALLHGAYGGMIDTSKINREQFNWLRSTRTEQ